MPGDGGWILPDDLDPERRCLQVHIPWNREYRAAWTGAIYELTRWFNWQRDGAHRGRLAAAVWAEVFREMIDMMDSDNPCPCEGEDMTDCCDPILEKLDIIIGLLSLPTPADDLVISDKRDAVEQIVKGDPFEVADLHPSAPDVSFTEGSDAQELYAWRYAALCYVLNYTVEVIKLNFNRRLLLDFLETGFALYFEGQWLSILGTMVVTGVYGTLANAVLKDQAAIEHVVCCMREWLVGKTVSRENLQAAAYACQDGANETIIGEMIHQFYSDDANFGAAVHDLGYSYELIKAGADLDCPCDNPEGVTCDSELNFQQFEMDYDGGNGWTPDSITGGCNAFGHVLAGGGTYALSVPRCLHLVQLNRFFGGTTSNEAVLARFEINGHVEYVPIVAGEHCTVIFDPPQVIDDGFPLRIDLIGGGERMCYTGLIVQRAELE